MSVREKDAQCKENILTEEDKKDDENKIKCGGVSKDDVISSFNYDTWYQK
jgi:hypothetical protein